MIKRTITKASKLRIISQKPLNNVETIIPNAEKGPRIEWYNDSFLLSERIQSLIAKDKSGITKAFDLINRHAGSSTKEVYGKMIAALANVGEYSQVLKLNQIILRRNRTLSPHGYTSLFSAIAKYAALGEDLHKSNCMQITDEIWKIAIAQPEISIQTVNALLHVCNVCCHNGGYNLAWEVFEQLGNVSKNPDPSNPLSKCKADHITYAMMMGVCTIASNEHASELGIQLWLNYLDLHAKKANNVPVTTIDNELIRKAVLFYSSLNQFDQGFDTINTFYGLCLKVNDSKLKRKVYQSDMTSLLKFCLDSKKPSLGLKWLDFVQSKQDNVFKLSNQFEFTKLYVESAIKIQSFEDAYKRLTDEDCPIIFMLWISYKAMKSKTFDDEGIKRWWSRVLQVQKHSDWGTQLGHIYFYMNCGLIIGENESVKSIINARKDSLLKHLPKKITRSDSLIDYDDFRINVRRLMRWRISPNPIK